LVAELKRQGIYGGPHWLRRLMADYAQASGLLSLTANRVDPDWPVRSAIVAEIVLAAREAVRVEELAK
jgi:hypothetical protein